MVGRRDSMGRGAGRGCLLLASIVGSGCAEAPGPLSRLAIDELSRSVGDAEGDRWTGAYTLTRPEPVPGRCGCDRLEAGAFGFGELEGFDDEVICAALVQTFVGTRGQRVELQQVEGFLSLRASILGERTQLTGPVDAGERDDAADSAQVGGVLSVGGLGQRFEVRSRWELTLSEDAGIRSFSGRARTFARSTITGQRARCRIDSLIEGSVAPP